MRHRPIAITGAILGWAAIVLQLYLIIVNRVAPFPEAIIRFFSYFTILTNLLVAICFTMIALTPNGRPPGFFARPKTLAATVVYITIVGLVYNLVLRSLWQPKGMQFIVDELLHSVIPLAFILYWFIYTPKTDLAWKDAITWLAYPLVYLTYVLVRGALSGFYPYPFINVSDIGYTQVFINCIGLAGAFLFFSLLLIAISKGSMGSQGQPELLQQKESWNNGN